MSIIVNENSRVVIQGITGNVGRSIAKKMIEDGTNLVCGVTPGKGGEKVSGVPVFETIEEALFKTKPNISFSTVPAPYVKNAILEALYFGIKQIVVYTEGVPVHDEFQLVHYAKMKEAMLLGPNSAGVVSPSKANVSDLNSKNLREGNVGIVSKSGTITYEVVDGLSRVGLGESTIICLGGDRVIGTTYTDILPLFEEDPDTKAVILIGEIGGTLEIEAASYIEKMTKPVFVYIAGQAVPPGKRMGHAGAIIEEGNVGSAKVKMGKLKKAGAFVANLLSDIPVMVAKNLYRKI